MMRRLLACAVVAALLGGGLVLAQGGVGPIGMLQGRVDSNNALVVTAATVGTVGSASSPIANLRGKVDSSNNLLVTLGAGSATPDTLCVDATNHDTCLGRGGAAGKLVLTGTTPMIQIGGTSSSFPALKQSSTTIQARLADDSAFSNFSVASLTLNTVGNGVFIAGGGLLASVTPVASPASCGSSPAVTNANGSTTFVVTGGTGGATSGCVVTMPTASNGWNCYINNITASAANRADRTTVQTASTTTSVTWQYQTVSTGAATNWTASDVFRGICFAY